jgi:hypothetical protein
MTEGFFGGLNRQLIFWSGWVFTVGGAVASLTGSREYAWIAGLVVVVGLAALTVFAYQTHRERVAAEQRHAVEKERLEAEARDAGRRADEAGRRLTGVSADILARIEAIMEGHAFHSLAAVLIGHAEYIGRMVGLRQMLDRPIAVRTFVKRAGVLYAETKLGGDAVARIRHDDPFFLEFKDANALQTRSAFIRVHQFDVAKDIVWFRVEYAFSDEIDRIDALAEKQVVKANGYTARPACDPEAYAKLNWADVTAAIRRLIDDVAQNRGGWDDSHQDRTDP